MVKYLAGTSDGTTYYKIAIKYFAGESDGRPFTVVPVVVPFQFSLVIRMKYIEGTVIVKREGRVVHYCTTYVPFEKERPVPVEESE
jgi:hypothetical protein